MPRAPRTGALEPQGPRGWGHAEAPVRAAAQHLAGPDGVDRIGGPRSSRRGHEDRIRLVVVIVVSFTRHIDISRADGGTYAQRRQRSGILRTRLLIGPQFLPARQYVQAPVHERRLAMATLAPGPRPLADRGDAAATRPRESHHRARTGPQGHRLRLRRRRPCAGRLRRVECSAPNLGLTAAASRPCKGAEPASISPLMNRRLQSR